MKYIVLFLVISFALSQEVSGQLIYPEIMTKRPALIFPVKFTYGRSPYPVRLHYRPLLYRSIENPGVRYAIQNLKKETTQDREIDNAVNTLLQYAEDSQTKRLLNYLRQYTKETGKKEAALNRLQEKITLDSIGYSSGEEEEILNSDLKTLVSYVNTDSNYVWLRNISRDSILLKFGNSKEQEVDFWINTGRNKYHRFWASNKQGDTIGTWIQVMPKGNNLRLYVDEDVYTAPRLETKSPEQSYIIYNAPNKEYFKLRDVKVGELRRRYWTYYSEVELAVSQGKLANWASGGENSISFLSNVRYYWNYNKNKTTWENWLHYRLGFMKNGEEDLRKNEDRFELNSKLGQKAFKHWYYTLQFNTQTQLFSSYEYPKDEDRKLVANFMSPGYFTLSLGLDYKPNENFSLLISPISGKWNFVRDSSKIDVGRYGVEKGKRSRREAGARIDLNSKINNLFGIMDIRNELRLFMSYEDKDIYKNKDKEDEERKKIPGTANWKLTIEFKINYFIRATIYTETIYDENYSKKLQFKENLNLGVNFRF